MCPRRARERGSHRRSEASAGGAGPLSGSCSPEACFCAARLVLLVEARVCAACIRSPFARCWIPERRHHSFTPLCRPSAATGAVDHAARGDQGWRASVCDRRSPFGSRASDRCSRYGGGVLFVRLRAPGCAGKAVLDRDCPGGRNAGRPADTLASRSRNGFAARVVYAYYFGKHRRGQPESARPARSGCPLRSVVRLSMESERTQAWLAIPILMSIFTMRAPSPSKATCTCLFAPQSNRRRS